MRPRTLRLRLLWAHVLTLSVGIGLLVSIGNVLIAHTIASDDRQRLTERLNAEVATLAVQGGEFRVRDTLDDQSLDEYGWVFADGRLLEHSDLGSPALTAVVAHLVAGGRSNVSRRMGSLLLGVRQVQRQPGATGGAAVAAGIDVADLLRLEQEILIGSIALGVILVLVGALVIVRVLGSALATVDRMTRVAAEWEAHDLDRRFHLGIPRDEITFLAATLDRLLGRIAASRRSEQRLAAEVAHELRTPLSAIRALAEMAVDSEPGAANSALRDVIVHSDRLIGTVGTLVAHARNEITPPAEGVDLRRVVDEFIDVAEITCAPALPRVEGDPRIVSQILKPILDNARRHAVSRIMIELTAQEETVHALIRDDGPGVDPELGVKVFIPGTRGAEEPEGGCGLGLSVAQRMAASCGGDVQLGQGPGGCFLITLRAASRAPVPTGVAGAGLMPRQRMRRARRRRPAVG